MAKSNAPETSLKKNMGYTAPVEQGMHGSKDNSECASLRMGNLPKSEAVRQATVSSTKAVECARMQNLSGDKDGKKTKGNLAVLPNTHIPAADSVND
jgi:hypothetical protein